MSDHICGSPNASCDQECADRFYQAQERRERDMRQARRSALAARLTPEVLEEARDESYQGRDDADGWKLMRDVLLAALLGETP